MFYSLWLHPFVTREKRKREVVPIDLDLIGYAGRYGAVFEFERYQLLQRSGMSLFPLTWYAWGRSREGCLDAIEAKFDMTKEEG